MHWIALDAPRGLLHDRREPLRAFPSAPKSFARHLSPSLSMAPSTLPRISMPFGRRRFGRDHAGLHRSGKEVCTLLAADLDERGLPGLVADDAPVPAGEVCLPRDLHLAPAAVGPPAVALLLELVHRDALVAALVLDDELALVDLLLVDRVRVDPELLLDHLPCHDRADRTTAVHADHDDVVQVDLLPLRQLVEAHHIAALDGDPDLHRVRLRRGTS